MALSLKKLAGIERANLRDLAAASYDSTIKAADRAFIDGRVDIRNQQDLDTQAANSRQDELYGQAEALYARGEITNAQRLEMMRSAKAERDAAIQAINERTEQTIDNLFKTLTATKSEEATKLKALEEAADVAATQIQRGEATPRTITTDGKPVENVAAALKSYEDALAATRAESAERAAARGPIEQEDTGSLFEPSPLFDLPPQRMAEVAEVSGVTQGMDTAPLYGITGASELYAQREAAPSVMTDKEADQKTEDYLASFGISKELAGNDFDFISNLYEKLGDDGAQNWLDTYAKDNIINFANQQFGEGPAGLSLKQADQLAKAASVYYKIGRLETEDGASVEDSLGALRTKIYNDGFENTLAAFEEQGITPYIRENYVDPTVARDFIKELQRAGGFRVSDEFADPWVPTVQREGFEGALKAFNEANNTNVGRIETALGGASAPNLFIQPFVERNNTALEALRTDYKTTFDDNVARILAGETVYSAPNISPSTAVDQLFQAEGFDRAFADRPEELQDAKNYWENYFDTWGVDAGVQAFNKQVNVDEGIFSSLYQPRDAQFGTVPIQQPLIDRGEPTLSITGAPQLPGQSTELGIPVQRGEVTPAAGLGAITSAYPTTGVPTGGTIPTTTYQPAPYTPTPLIAQAPSRPSLTPAQQTIGAPGIDRGVPVPMQALTPEQAGSRFVAPTQEDYYAFFGYTPEQLNAAQYLAELEGAPRAGIAAQTVPTLPPAVTGAPAPTEMNKGGMPQDAQRLAAQGRGEDTMLIHMSPQEIAGLQGLAQQMGTSLSINPHTGLPEADVFNKIGKTLKKYAPEIATVAMYAAGVPLPVAAFASGTAHAIGSGSLEQGIARGISAYGVGSMAATGMQMAGVGPTAGGSTASAGMGSIPLTPSPGDLDYISSVDKNLLGRATDYAMTVPSTVPQNFEQFIERGALPAVMGTSAGENIALTEAANKQEKVNNAIYASNLEDERKKNRRLFESTLGSVPLQYARKGGLMQLAGGGMTYAEGGGTTGATNEPRMVKGTGDGMSDSVPATIEGVQEARLANDEFVIPADVVADLGNGSSSAGAQQLYDMMDRVRQARHGTTEQPPEIDVQKLMPA